MKRECNFREGWWSEYNGVGQCLFEQQLATIERRQFKSRCYKVLLLFW